jgi:hypothetical protein
MALTTIDPRSALPVIDLQKGLVGSPLIHPIGETATSQEIIDLLPTRSA